MLQSETYKFQFHWINSGSKFSRYNDTRTKPEKKLERYKSSNLFSFGFSFMHSRWDRLLFLLFFYIYFYFSSVFISLMIVFLDDEFYDLNKYQPIYCIFRSRPTFVDDVDDSTATRSTERRRERASEIKNCCCCRCCPVLFYACSRVIVFSVRLWIQYTQYCQDFRTQCEWG